MKNFEKGLLILILGFILGFGSNGCANGQMPTSFGIGDPSDDAISCVEDLVKCSKHCETVIDGKVVAFTDTPIPPERCTKPE